MKTLEFTNDQLITLECALRASIREMQELIKKDNQASCHLQAELRREQEVLALIQTSGRV